MESNPLPLGWFQICCGEYLVFLRFVCNQIRSEVWGFQTVLGLNLCSWEAMQSLKIHFGMITEIL